MKKSKLIFVICVLTISVCMNLFAVTLNDTQIIKSDHWIYDALYLLFTKSGKTCPGNSFPITVGELKFLLKQIDTSELDSQTMNLYTETYNFLYESSDFGKRFGLSSEETDFLRFGGSIQVTPEMYLKTNNDITWHTFINDPYFKNDFASSQIFVGFDNYFTMETDFYYGKNLDSARSNENWFNLAMKPSDSDYLLPRFAYGSTGFVKDNWGLSFHIATSGLTIGKTQTGSIIYNRTFETTAYTELNIYSNRFSYALDVSQIDYNRFMYLHHVEIRPFDNLKLSVIEGGMAASSFEIRYLNPFMLIHSFRPIGEYMQIEDPNTYGADRKYCAYLGISSEFVPCKNLRIYALWAQNEIQIPFDLKTDFGRLFADGFGIQAGAETFLSGGGNRIWKINLETIYTLPYLYIKQSPQSSLYRARKKFTYYYEGVVNSWIGTPFGPDCFALQANLSCNSIGKWSADLSYILAIHGEMGFGIFTDSRWAFQQNGKTYYAYYPLIKDRAIKAGVINSSLTTADCIKEARNHLLTGTLEYRNDIVLNGSYVLNDYCEFAAQFVYTFIFNCNHIKSNFQQGVELAFSATLKYF